MLELASRQLAFTDTGRQRERFQHDRQKLFFPEISVFSPHPVAQTVQ